MSVNMVLLGALSQTGILPISGDHIRTAIRTHTKKSFNDINIKAFDLGYAAASSCH
jgi:indolepyruvate ferredoxin oxidoreductase beta subunit